MYKQVLSAGQLRVQEGIAVGLVMAMMGFAGCAVSKTSSGLELQDLLAASMDSPASSSEDEISVRKGLQNFNRRINAVGAGWALTVSWCDGSLTRHVTWQVGSDHGELVVALRERPAPWTYSLAGVTTTKYGPYQPALQYNADGVQWSVTMSHERADFPTAGDLERYLSRDYPSDPSHAAFDPHQSMLVILHMTRKGETDAKGRKFTGNSLSIDVMSLSIDGEALHPERYSSLAKGSITRIKP